MKTRIIFAFAVCLSLLVSHEKITAGNPSQLARPDSYSVLWQKADSLADLGLPKSALALVESIYLKAKTEKNDPQFIKAVIYRLKLQSAFMENFHIEAITSLNKEISTSHEPVKQLLQSLLAEVYWKYYQNNRYRFNDRTQVLNNNSDSIQTWDLNRISRQIIKSYIASLENPALLRSIPIGNYEVILEKPGDKENLRPTLYDFIAWRALDYFMSKDGPKNVAAENYRIDESVFFLPAARFGTIRILLPVDSTSLGSFAIRLFRDLASFHLADKDPSALIDEELQRLEFVWQNAKPDGKDSLYLFALTQLEQAYNSSPASAFVSYAIANFYSRQGSQYLREAPDEHRWDLKKAVETCAKAITRFPESDGAKNCMYLMEQLKEPSIQLSVKEETIPEKPSLAAIELKNTDTVYFRIVRTDPEKDMDDHQFTGRDALLAGYLALPAAESWMQKFPDEGDYRPHLCEAGVPALPAGYYILLASSGKDFRMKQDIIAFASFFSTQISYISQRNDKGGTDIYILDRETGKPMKNALVELFLKKYDYRTRKNISTKTGTYTTSSDGFLSFPGLQKGDYSAAMFLKLTLKNDIYVTGNFSRSYIPETKEKSILQTWFFLDRGIYRPGQTVYFKGIVLEKSGDNMRIRQHEQTTVILRDVNSQEIGRQTFTTNEYGSFNGSFTAPVNVLTGQMTISNGSGTASFQVEEYKRPTFEVTMNQPEGNYRLNDSISVTGKASAFAGNNIDGATVSYRIVRNVYFPYFYRWWYPYPVAPEVEIGHGTTTTGADGGFSVRFKAIPDGSQGKEKNPVFNYSVYADVTDLNGETRSSETVIPVGYTSLLIGTDVPDRMDLSRDSAWKVTATNLNGRPVAAEVTITIQKLRQPARLFRSRFADRPDISVMSREEFYSKFPYDIYMDDDNPAKWQVESTLLERTMNPANDSLLHIIDVKGAEPDPGVYVLTMKAKDPYGNPVETKKYFTALNPSRKEMPVYSLNWFVPLKTKCEPGENAEFLIGSKEKVNVIYEVRVHDSLVSREWLSLDDNQVKITVPVKESYRGNFVVNFVFVKYNRTHQNSQVVTVPFTNKKLDIAIETFRNKMIPGGNEEWKIRIADASGKGTDAEFLAAMYDESLDAFRPNEWGFSIYPSYYWGSLWGTSDAFGISSGSGYREMASYPFTSHEYDRLNWFGLNYFSGRSIYTKSGRMMNDKVLGADNALPTAEAITETTATAEQSAKGEPPVPEIKPAVSQFQVRRDFRETAFFYPSIVTDNAGNLSVSFTVPESLTRWKILAFAHTQQLAYGLLQKEAVTQKDLMVFPNPPRFVRQGDTVVFSAKVVNLSNRTLTGDITIEFTDAITQKPLNLIVTPGNPASFSTLPTLLKTGESSSYEWKLAIPVDAALSVLQYRIVARAGDFSDGEEKAISVLTNRMLVTETMPMPVTGKGDFDFKFGKLLQSSTAGSMKNYRLTLEFASNPAWYAVQALPSLEDPRYPNADNIFNAFYANSIATHIANSDPKIKLVFESWKNLTPEALLSNLEKNEQLKSALLRETPWVLEGKSESERKQRLALLFDLNTMTRRLDDNLSKIKKLQSANGGWPWFEGMKENRFITQDIVTGLGHLSHLGIADILMKSSATHEMLMKAVAYLDGELVTDYENLKKYYPEKMEENHLGVTQIQYLYARSYFLKDLPLEASQNKGAFMTAFSYFRKQAEKYWLSQDLCSQGMIALALNRLGNKEVPAAILRSLSEKALHSKEMGMYWAANGGYEWYQAPVETQAMLIEAYDEIAADKKAVDEMKIWLLKQKQTQEWKTGRATVEACYALLLRGTDLLATEPGVKISIGKETIDPAKLQDNKAEAGTGYFQVAWNGKEIDPGMGNVKVAKSTDGVAWGAVYWQYFEDLDKITSAKSPLKIEKKLFIEKNTENGPALKEITDYELRITNYGLRVGDKLKVRIILTVDRNLEFVHMKDMRASAFEPYAVPSSGSSPLVAGSSEAGMLSGYRYQGGLGYYQSTTDEATNFFFDYLPKGTWVFEYPLVVNAAGNYSNGITTVQCLYAPGFAAHSEGIRVAVGR